MLEQHREAPGVALDLSTLMEGGWPDQTLTYDSGSQRVYAAIKQLRKIGFGEVVLTGEDGYLIDPAIDVIWED